MLRERQNGFVYQRRRLNLVLKCRSNMPPNANKRAAETLAQAYSRISRRAFQMHWAVPFGLTTLADCGRDGMSAENGVEIAWQTQPVFA